MKGWVIPFFVAHVVQFIFLTVLLWHYDFVSASSTVPGNVYAIIGQQIPPNRIQQAIDNPDALQIAYNVGVLELLSLGITIFGVVLALIAVIGFWTIRAAAMRSAYKAAQEEIRTELPRMARAWFEDKGRAIIAESGRPSSGSQTPAVGISPSTIATVIDNANEIDEL